MKIQEKIRAMREARNWSQDEIIDFQKREIACLEEIIELMKKVGDSN